MAHDEHGPTIPMVGGGDDDDRDDDNVLQGGLLLNIYGRWDLSHIVVIELVTQK